MIKRRAEMAWFPFWPEKWLSGSMRIEFGPAERSIWVDLLCLASKDNGYIRANEDIPYPLEQLAGMLLVPLDLLGEFIKKTIDKKKLTELNNGTLYITKWDKYQLSESFKRVAKHRAKNPSCNGKRYNVTKNVSPLYVNLNLIKDQTIKREEQKEVEYARLGFNPIDVRLCQLLIDLMLVNDPKSSIIKRLTPKRQEEWIRQCRLLREADERSEEDIETIVRWCQKDSFWKSNVLSMPKLREKFPQLWLKAKKTNFAGIQEWLAERRRKREGL